jgi:hypothetical protein
VSSVQPIEVQGAIVKALKEMKDIILELSFTLIHDP